MGVYVKGMEMPKSCYKCDMRRRDGMDIVCPIAHERFSVADVNILEYRLDSCPLVPVPPHGKLGDLDALAGYIHQQEDWLSEAAIHAFCGILCKMPTIIPADPAKEG